MKNSLYSNGRIGWGYRAPAFGWLIALLATFSLLLANYTPANSMAPRPHCKVCRRFTDTSPARMETSYRFGRRVVNYRLCSMFCYLEFIEDFTGEEQLSTRVVKYTPAEQEFQLSVNVDRAYFLYEVEGDEQKTHAPFTLAFGSESEATTAQEELGGQVMRFDELTELVQVLTDEYEPENRAPKHKPNRHGNR